VLHLLLALLVPLMISTGAYAVAFVSILRPDAVRSWMRDRSPGIAPPRVRESGIEIAPTVYAIVGFGIGSMALLLFISTLAELFM
jgi:hypothetical protein